MGMIQIGIVTGKETAKNKDGTKEVLLLQVQMEDPEDIQTVELMSQTGENSNPPVGSRVIVMGAGPAFKLAIASDDSIVPTTEDGEKLIYSTDEDGAVVVSSIYLKNDGTMIADNGEVTITATPGGLLSIVASGNTEITSAKTIINNDLEVIGKITATENIESGTEVIAPQVTGTTEVTGGGKDLSTHPHEPGTYTAGATAVTGQSGGPS